MVCTIPESAEEKGDGASRDGQAVDRKAAAKARTPARLRRCWGSGTMPSTEASGRGCAQNGHAGSWARTCRWHPPQGTSVAVLMRG